MLVAFWNEFCLLKPNLSILPLHIWHIVLFCVFWPPSKKKKKHLFHYSALKSTHKTIKYKYNHIKDSWVLYLKNFMSSRRTKQIKINEIMIKQKSHYLILMYPWGLPQKVNPRDIFITRVRSEFTVQMSGKWFFNN